jgi:hypothetical protein
MDMRGTLDLLETLAGQVEVETLADEALNEAVRYIQDRLGVETGDLAGRFFTGEFEDVVKRVLIKYIEQEMEEMEDESKLDEYLDDTANTDESFGGAMTSFKP